MHGTSQCTGGGAQNQQNTCPRVWDTDCQSVWRDWALPGKGILERHWDWLHKWALYQGTTEQAAGKGNAEGGGVFNPRTKPTESAWASAPEECLSLFSSEVASLSAVCSVVPKKAHKQRALAPDGKSFIE
jgi:hypothetical protein